MKLILLSGGSGKRLWPLSNEARSKQFLKVLQDEKGNSESMIQRIYKQIHKSCPEAEVIIASSEAQSDSIRRQLGSQVEKVEEPSRRNTYPAILLSATYLLDKRQVPEEEVVAVLPVDTYVEQDYFDKLQEMEQALLDAKANICLLGVKPTYPSEKYGYIRGRELTDKSYGLVADCVEKPDLQTAQKLMEEGAFWSGGVFVFRLGFLKKLIQKEMGQVSFEQLYARYDELPKSSFDNEVIARTQSMVFVRYDGEWNDLGTWNTLTEQMKEADGGIVIRDENCKNTHVINELEIPIVALGLQDTVVVASADGILVSDKHSSSFLNPYVEQIHNRPMYEKRQWGEYKVLNFAKCHIGRECSLTKHMHVEAGRSLSYQMHHLRDEVWTIIDGEGQFLLNGEMRKVTRGEVLYIKRGQWHAMASKEGIDFIEVQLGTDLVEEDIERDAWDWGNIL